MRWLRRSARPVIEPPAVDLTPPDTLGRFAEAVALWACGARGAPDDAVMLACDLLVEGYDTPALRDVAAFSADALWWDCRDVLERAFVELGLRFTDRASDEARLLALQSHCRSFLTGDLPEQDFVRAASILFNYDAPEVAHDLSQLELEIEGAQWRWGRDVSGLPDRYAREFLAAVSTGSTRAL